MLRFTESARALFAKTLAVSSCLLRQLISAEQATCYPLAIPKLNKVEVI